MTEEGYKPNGWLGIQLGTAIWIPCWSIPVVESNVSTLLERAKVRETIPKTVASNSASKAVTARQTTSPVSRREDTKEDMRVTQLLNTMQSQLSEMQHQLTQMQEQMRLLNITVEETNAHVKKFSAKE